MTHGLSPGASGYNQDHTGAEDECQGKGPREEIPQHRQAPGRCEGSRRPPSCGLKKPSQRGSSRPWVMGLVSNPALVRCDSCRHLGDAPPFLGLSFPGLYNERQGHRFLSLESIVWLMFGVKDRASLEHSPFWTTIPAPLRSPGPQSHFIQLPASGHHSFLPDQITWVYVLF